jgi:uracil-DNA glycosylase
MERIDPKINEEWKDALSEQFASEYFRNLKLFLIDERSKFQIYPPGDRIFAAFDITPFTKVKVVIIGQDPYHGAGQANGLCFSVSPGVAHPPSLVNIFKEISSDLGHPYPQSGDLEKWARQGVLLINATLTVRAGSAGSHQNKGWETFTDAAIKALSDSGRTIIFLLWGRFAQQKERLIDTSKHLILKSGHPSPMSANQGLWFGNRHFSKTNEFLTSRGEEPVDWQIV